MKHTVFIAAIIAAFVFAVDATAQSISVSIIPNGDKETTVVNFPSPAGRNFVIFEAVIPASTAAECMASRDFSNAVPVSPDRAAAIYDPVTLTYYLRNTSPIETRPSCKVLIARAAGVDTSDLNVWRANYGATGGFADVENESSAKGSAQRSMIRSVTVTFNGAN
jgi:hypothetical protein